MKSIPAILSGVLFTLVSVASMLMPGCQASPPTDEATTATNDADSGPIVVAVITSDGREVHVVGGDNSVYKEKALSIAKRKAMAERDRAAKGGRQYDIAPPNIHSYPTSEALLSAVGTIEKLPLGVTVLNNRRKCGRHVPGSDTGCRGTVRTIHYEHDECVAGNKYDDCSETKSVIERTITYPTTQACANDDVAGASIRDTKGWTCP